MTSVKKYFPAVFGAAICAASLVVILTPGNMAPGGISAIAVMISHFIPVKTGTILFLLNIPLLAVAFIKDKNFFKTTVAGSLAYPVFANVASYIPVPSLDSVTRFALGGTLMGVGMGIVLASGGSTGGSDILAWLIKRKYPHIKIGRAIVLVDVIIITAGAFVFKSLQSAIYASMTLFLSAMVIDRVIEGRVQECKTVFVVSNFYKSISDELLSKLERGVTALMAKGMYTGDEKRVLLCSVTVKQLPALMKIISDIDSDAFVIVADTREISGNGFNNIDR